MGTQSFVFLKVSNMAKFPQKRGIPPERTARGNFLLTLETYTQECLSSNFQAFSFENKSAVLIFARSVSCPPGIPGGSPKLTLI